MTSLVLTVIAPDQPGLIEQLSQTIVDHEGNWLESSISRLAGQFAGILIVAVADKQADSLTDALKQLESQGLTVLVERSSQPPLANHHQQITLSLIGSDHPGIVREISQALNRYNIKVGQLNTELFSGSMSADKLFKADAELLVPAEVDLDDLQDTLEAIAGDLMVDLTLD